MGRYLNILVVIHTLNPKNANIGKGVKIPRKAKGLAKEHATNRNRQLDDIVMILAKQYIVCWKIVVKYYISSEVRDRDVIAADNRHRPL